VGSLHGFQIDADRRLSRLSEADGPLGTIVVREAAGSLLTDPAEITQIIVAGVCVPSHLRASRGTRQLTWFSDAGSYEADPEAANVMHHEADATASQGAVRWEDRLSSTAIPLMLGERGGLPMHASAVRLGGSALLICALSGRGKSTLAALMASRGHRQIAEDGVVVFEQDDVPVVWPGQIGSLVTDESMAAFGAGSATLEPAPADLRGRRFRVIGEPVREPTPIAAVAILMARGGDRVQVTRPSLPQVHRELLVHVLSGGRRSRASFTASARLVQRVPVTVITAPDDIESLPATADALESLCSH
jgi:hypothetical protein